MKGSGHRLLPHTADMGIEAWAKEPEELFVAAARGLKEMIFGEAPIATAVQRQVHLEAEETAELLVVWLNEILYQREVNLLAPSTFRIERLEEGRLDAVILGEAYAPERHPIEHQVKAVTYHQLTFEKQHEGWYARLFVDL